LRPVAAVLSSLLTMLMAQSRAQAQIPGQEPHEFWRPSAVNRDLATGLTLASEAREGPPRPPPVRMYSMLPGFLSDPAGFGGNDDPVDLASVTGNYFGSGEMAASGLNGLLLSVGNYNPFFELRRPGDPGSIGYLRVHSQLQVLETGGTSVCLGLRAWTPAGVECGGVSSGPTTIAPGLGVFQDLGSGTGLHGYFDQNFRGACRQHGPLHYGVGMHCPLFPWEQTDDASVYLFMQALGRYDFTGERLGRKNWEFVPGVYWRFTDNCWFSLGASRTSMLTWMLQY
jgi:hypothetical protein